MRDLTEDQLDEISKALREGKQIAAIKLYREATGAGLKEAKDAIDSIALGAALASTPGGNDKTLTEEQLDRISKSILEGRKIDAIRAYRELTRLGLKDSKEEIEKITLSLAKDHPELLQKQSKGCASVIVFGFCLGYASYKIFETLPIS